MPASHVFTPAIAQLTSAGAAPPAKAYTGPVAAGDLLWAFVWVNSASTTVTSVSDSLNGAWTAAFGPVRGAAANFNASLYGFYRPNSAAGTPSVTVTLSANTVGGFVIGAITGLAGGGALDVQQAVQLVGPQADGWALATGALSAAAGAGVGFFSASSIGSGLAARWTADLAVDSQMYERVQRTITSSTASTTFGLSGGAIATGAVATAGLMMFRDVGASDTEAPSQAGAITIGTVTSSSIQLSWPAGADNTGVVGYDVSRDGGATWTQLGNVLTHTWTGLAASTTYQLRVRPRDAAGNVDATPLAASQATAAASSTATITVPGLAAWTNGTVLAGLTVPNLVVVRRSDRVQVLELANQVANGSGDLVVTDAALSAGVGYMVLGFTTDGVSSFRCPVTAA